MTVAAKTAKPKTLRNLECNFEGMVEAVYLFAGQRAHLSSESVFRHGEYIVEIRDARARQPFATPQNDFGGQAAVRPGDERDHDRTDGVDHGITSQDDDGA